jgi:ATP-dependent RNA helicase RhlE
VFDHLGRGTLDLRHTRFVILDEADRMLDVGFAPAIDAILARIPGPRQTSLFSATFPREVEAMVGKHTHNAVRIAVDVPGAALESLEERFMPVLSDDEKLGALTQILNLPDCKLALVFRRTTHRADKLSRLLERQGVRVATLHGRRSQAQRETALGALRTGKVQALVATDIAARGLDISGLTHVVNFDLPDTAENYTHRVGRTARMGAVGVAITLVTPEDEDALRSLQRKLPSTPGRQAAIASRPQRSAPGRPAHAAPSRERGTQTHGQRPSNERAVRPRRPIHDRAAHSVRPTEGERAPTSEQLTQRPTGEASNPRRFEQRPAAPAGNQQATGTDESWYPFRSRQSEPGRPAAPRGDAPRGAVPSWYPASSRRG